MNFGSVLKGFSSGMQGSPMSRMNSQQKLQALGAAFSGDQNQLAQVMGSLEPAPSRAQRPRPILNEDGEDISAAFGGEGTADGPVGMPPMGLGGMLMRDGGKALMSGAFGLGGMLLGRGFGFGKKKDR